MFSQLPILSTICSINYRFHMCHKLSLSLIKLLPILQLVLVHQLMVTRPSKYNLQKIMDNIIPFSKLHFILKMLTLGDFMLTFSFAIGWLITLSTISDVLIDAYNWRFWVWSLAWSLNVNGVFLYSHQRFWNLFDS